MQGLLLNFPIQYQDSNHDMKLRDDDKKWLADEISGQVEHAIASAIDDFRPHGWRRVTDFIRSWGIAGTIVAVFVGLLTLAAAAFYQATARVGKQATFEANTTRDLAEIRSDIQAIRGDFAKQSIINHATMPLSEFKNGLTDLGSAVAAVQTQKLKLPDTVINDLSQKLAAIDTSTPGFWTTAGAVISYRSSLLTGGSVEAWQVFPRCQEPVDMDASPNAAAQVIGKD